MKNQLPNIRTQYFIPETGILNKQINSTFTASPKSTLANRTIDVEAKPIINKKHSIKGVNALKLYRKDLDGMTKRDLFRYEIARPSG